MDESCGPSAIPPHSSRLVVRIMATREPYALSSVTSKSPGYIGINLAQRVRSLLEGTAVVYMTFVAL